MNYITKTVIGGIRPINITAFPPPYVDQLSLHLSYENYLGAYSLIKNNKTGVGDSGFVCRISHWAREITTPEYAVRSQKIVLRISDRIWSLEPSIISPNACMWRV